MSATYVAGLSGLGCFATASALFLAAYPTRSRQVVLLQLAIALLTIGTIAVTFSAFGRYSGRVWADSSGLILAICIGWFTLIASWRYDMKVLGTFTAPVATLVLFLKYFFVAEAPRSHLDHSLEAVLAGLHVLMAVIGEAFAICACAISVLYLTKQSALKSKQLAKLPHSTPALDRLGKLLMASLWAGFIFISIGLLTGVIYTQEFIDKVTMDLSLKITWGILVWLLYLLTIGSHIVLGWNIRKVSYLSFAGFMLLTVSLFGLIFSRPFGG